MFVYKRPCTEDSTCRDYSDIAHARTHAQTHTHTNLFHWRHVNSNIQAISTWCINTDDYTVINNGNRIAYNINQINGTSITSPASSSSSSSIKSISCQRTNRIQRAAPTFALYPSLRFNCPRMPSDGTVYVRCYWRALPFHIINRVIIIAAIIVRWPFVPRHWRRPIPAARRAKHCRRLYPQTTSGLQTATSYVRCRRRAANTWIYFTAPWWWSPDSGRHRAMANVCRI